MNQPGASFDRDVRLERKDRIHMGTDDQRLGFAHAWKTGQYIPHLINANILQLFIGEQLPNELRSFLFMERRRGNLLDLNSKFNQAVYKISHHTSRTISLNALKRASA